MKKKKKQQHKPFQFFGPKTKIWLKVIVKVPLVPKKINPMPLVARQIV
jgi:hypothetical protein